MFYIGCDALLNIIQTNTSLNKSWAWHIDGATNKQNPYDFYKVFAFI